MNLPPTPEEADGQHLFSFAADCYRLKAEGTMVEWADGYLVLPNSTRCPIFSAEEAPWILPIMRAFNDPVVREIHVRGPAGSAKSLIGQVAVAYIIENSPGPTYYVWQTDDDSKDAMEDWIIPMLEKNPILYKRLPVDRSKKRATKIAFPHMPFYSVGANKSSARSKRIKYLLMEEPHLYPPGMFPAMKKRVEAVRGYKILSMSTGSIEGDESDSAHAEGTCEEWEVPCPYCGQFQTKTDHRDRLKADVTKETVTEEGAYIWNKILPTVRYNCESCGKDWPRDYEFRWNQAQLGRYKITNPNASAEIRSFHWEAVSVPWIEEAKVLEEKLKASYVANRGSLEPLKIYVQERRGLPWDNAPATDDEFDIERLKGVYVKRFAHPEEITRFMTVDNQKGRYTKGESAHRWVVVRAWGEKESWLVEEKKITTWEEIEEERIKLQVEPKRTWVDVAYDTANVQAITIKYGWQGLWGEMSKRRSFPHHEVAPNGEKATRQLLYSGVQWGNIGRTQAGNTVAARYYLWCTQPIRELYQRLRRGLTSYRFSVASNTSDDYFKHTAVEYQKTEYNKAGARITSWERPEAKADHLLDCDQMNLLVALMDYRIHRLLFEYLGDGDKKAE